MKLLLPKGAPRKFGLIHADPPWAYATYNGDKIPARNQHYKTMKIEELKAMELPAADDCVLIMWTISSHVDQTLDLGKTWGFTYKSLGFVWVKTCKGDPEKPKMSMGKWIRQESEIAFLFSRGKPKRLDAGVRQVIMEPAREHSRKPEEVYPRCERLAAGPMLDLFGRCTRPGWTTWGDQADKFDIGQDLTSNGRTARRPLEDIL